MSEILKKDLIFSPKEEIIFWLAGYRETEDRGNVSKIINSLQNDLKLFSQYLNCDESEVNYIKVKESSRYKHYRVLYVNKEHVENVELVEEFFKINNSKMFDFLQN